MNIYSQLERDEGFRARPYQDSRGVWTVGYGFNLQSGVPLSPFLAGEIMREHVSIFITDLNNRLPWVRQLSAPRFGVLINMAYNMGIWGLMSFKRMLKALEREDYPTAAVEMLDSKWAKQVGDRAKRLAQQMCEDMWV